MPWPIPLTFAPMDALLAGELPTGNTWQYEPKWDGFRCLAFRDGAKVELQSKSGQPLGRYFPEIVEALAALKPTRFVLDGELVVPQQNALSFDALLQRIHPAASRVKKLSVETPAVFILFDLLANLTGAVLTSKPLSTRRKQLETFFKTIGKAPRLLLSPATTSLKQASAWFGDVGQKGEALDGVVAKRLDLPYQSGNRDGMVKVKKIRTADCVVGGFRYAAKGKTHTGTELGSLLLGLFDADGKLQHVGFTSAFAGDEREKILRKITPLIRPPGFKSFSGEGPGRPSRWSTERSVAWQPLVPELVIEVTYDHFTGGRFRHGTKLIRFRPDKAPTQCTLTQVQQESKTGARSLLKFVA